MCYSKEEQVTFEEKSCLGNFPQMLKIKIVNGNNLCWVHTDHQTKKEIKFSFLLRKFAIFTFKIKFLPFWLPNTVFKFLKSAFQCSKSCFSNDLHSPEHRHQSNTLNSYYLTKMKR